MTFSARQLLSVVYALLAESAESLDALEDGLLPVDSAKVQGERMATVLSWGGQVG